MPDPSWFSKYSSPAKRFLQVLGVAEPGPIRCAKLYKIAISGIVQYPSNKKVLKEL